MASAEVNFEKKAQLWMGLLIIALSVIYMLTSLGRSDLTKYFGIVFGYFLSIFLYIESGMISWFQSKGYRKITFSDIILVFTVMSATIIAINTTLFFQVVKDNAPTWLITFSTYFGVGASIASTILAIFYILTPRFKA